MFGYWDGSTDAKDVESLTDDDVRVFAGRTEGTIVQPRERCSDGLSWLDNRLSL